jgi:hypothetical protein
MDQPVNGPRDAALIAVKIMCVIPDTHDAFREEIRAFLNDAAYKAPELLCNKECWMSLEQIMHKHVPEPDAEWKQKVIDFYIGKIQTLDIEENPKPKRARRMTIDTNL